MDTVQLHNSSLQQMVNTQQEQINTLTETLQNHQVALSTRDEEVSAEKMQRAVLLKMGSVLIVSSLRLAGLPYWGMTEISCVIQWVTQQCIKLKNIVRYDSNVSNLKT